MYSNYLGTFRDITDGGRYEEQSPTAAKSSSTCHMSTRSVRNGPIARIGYHMRSKEERSRLAFYYKGWHLT